MNLADSLNLRYIEKIERLSREESAERSKVINDRCARGALESGGTVIALVRLKTDYAEKKLLAFVESVKELIDLGTIKPSAEAKASILPTLEAHLKSLEKFVAQSSPPELLGYKELYAREIENAIPPVLVRVCRRFDLMFFDEGEKAKMNRTGPITVGTINVTGILNLGDIVGDINQSINKVQNAGSEQIAGILKEIAQAC